MEQLTPEVLGIIAWTVGLALVGGAAWVARPEIAAFLGGLLDRYTTVKTFAPAPADYDNPGEDEPAAQEAPVPAFERAERPLFVPPVQLPNGLALSELDIARIDTLARLMAAGAVSESTAITAVWDGRGGAARVSKGGSKAYTDRRDALRALALAYGWQPAPPAPPAEDEPDDPRLVPINRGKFGHVELP